MFARDIEVDVYRSRVKIPMIFLVPTLLLVHSYAMLYLYVNSSYFVETITETVADAIPGDLQVDDIIVSPSLVDIDLIGAQLRSAEGESIVVSERIHASINPLLLSLRRLHIREVRLRKTRFDMSFEADDRLNLLAALGIEESSTDDEPSLIEGVSIVRIFTQDCAYSLDLGFLRLNFPDINFENGEVHVLSLIHI